MNKIIQNFVHLLVPLFILHLTEELTTNFYQTDDSIKQISEYLQVTTQVTFFITQIVLLIFLGILLLLILKKKNIPSTFVVILCIISIYEFSHIYEVAMNKMYIGGSVTGTIIAIMGLILVYKVFIKKFNNPLNSTSFLI